MANAAYIDTDYMLAEIEGKPVTKKEPDRPKPVTNTTVFAMDNEAPAHEEQESQDCPREKKQDVPSKIKGLNFGALAQTQESKDARSSVPEVTVPKIVFETRPENKELPKPEPSEDDDVFEDVFEEVSEELAEPEPVEEMVTPANTPLDSDLIQDVTEDDVIDPATTAVSDASPDEERVKSESISVPTNDTEQNEHSEEESPEMKMDPVSSDEQHLDVVANPESEETGGPQEEEESTSFDFSIFAQKEPKHIHKTPERRKEQEQKANQPKPKLSVSVKQTPEQTDVPASKAPAKPEHVKAPSVKQEPAADKPIAPAVTKKESWEDQFSDIFEETDGNIGATIDTSILTFKESKEQNITSTFEESEVIEDLPLEDVPLEDVPSDKEDVSEALIEAPEEKSRPAEDVSAAEETELSEGLDESDDEAFEEEDDDDYIDEGPSDEEIIAKALKERAEKEEAQKAAAKASEEELTHARPVSHNLQSPHKNEQPHKAKTPEDVPLQRSIPGKKEHSEAPKNERVKKDQRPVAPMGGSDKDSDEHRPVRKKTEEAQRKVRSEERKQRESSAKHGGEIIQKPHEKTEHVPDRKKKAPDPVPANASKDNPTKSVLLLSAVCLLLLLGIAFVVYGMFHGKEVKASSVPVVNELSTYGAEDFSAPVVIKTASVWDESDSFYEGMSEFDKTTSVVNINDMSAFNAYQQVNTDVVGIVQIEGTVLNHPFCQTVNDEEYYLTHDITGETNSHGVPFLSSSSEWLRPGSNIVMYGHNIRKNGKDVFADLADYEDIEFYKAHPIIKTISAEGTKSWLVFAYYLIDTSDSDVFRYSDTTYFSTENEFYTYISEVEKRNWLNLGEQHFYSFGDTFLTLSSCSNELAGSGTNRMVIMAKLLKNGEDYSDIVAGAKQEKNPVLPRKLANLYERG